MQTEFHSATVADGFTLHVAPTEKFKSTSMQLVVRRNLQPDVHSLAAVIPFVLRRGTRRLPTLRDIARNLEQLFGAQLSTDIGKLGETQNIELFVQVAHERFLPEPAGLTEQAVRLLAEVLTEPLLEEGRFKEEYVRQEAETLRRRIERTINNPPQYAVNRLREMMCKDEPFGLHKYGDKDDLSKVESKALYEHYEHVLKTSPVDLFVVGPVDPTQIQALVKEHIVLPRARVTDVVPVVVDDSAASAREVQLVTEEQRVQQGVLTLGYRTGIKYADDDYAALLVYNGILGGYPHSKLFLNVREKASLAYFASSQLETTKGVLIIAAGIAVDKYEQALDIIRAQVKALAEGDISDAELEQTKKGLVNDMLSGKDSPGRMMGVHYLGIVNGRLRPTAETVAAVQAVTKEDVVRVASRLREDTVFFLRSPQGD